MKKIAQIFSGMLVMIFGINFTSGVVKTDFQRMLETKISVDTQDADVQPTCGGYCGSGGNN